MNDLRAHLDAMKAADVLAVTPIHRTRYGIRLRTGFWAGHNHHWVERSEDAVQFDFVTPAEGYATCALDLNIVDYTVEAL